jgi:predicted ester cyclase
MRSLLLATLILAAASTASAADLEANKQLYRDFVETVVNKRQPDALGRFMADDLVEHNATIAQVGRKKFLAGILAGFSDYHGDIQEILAEGNRIVVRTVWTGTQDGPFLDLPPSGRKLRFTTADFFRIENGKLVEHWDVVDSLPRAVALGLVPPPKPPAPVAPK